MGLFLWRLNKFLSAKRSHSFEYPNKDQWDNWWRKQGYDKCHEESPFSEFNAAKMLQFRNPMLQKYIPQYSKKSSKVLVTLCGNSPDMKWLAENGYEVVGVEWSEEAILQFIRTNRLNFQRSNEKDFVVYKISNLKSPITLYVGDFLKFTVEVSNGKFDFVWDCASLQAIPISSREPYSEIIKQLVHQDSIYLLSAMYFGDLRTWKENPYELPDEDLQKLYEDKFIMETVERATSEYGVERIIVFRFK